MKSLVVTDYDDTIKINNNIELTKRNIRELKLLNGECKLMISTGRLYKSIRYDVVKYCVPFDYISCANGNILFDKKFDVISKKNIDSRAIKELKEYYKLIESIDALNEYGVITQNKPVEYFIHIINDNKIRRMVVDKLVSIPNIDYCTDGNNRYDIHVFSKSSKIRTIELLRRILQLEKKDIYTIGDGLNDLDMLLKYNGSIVGNKITADKIPVFEDFSMCKEALQYKLKKGS